MRGPIDLTPRSCRLKLGAKARRRKWIVSYASVAIAGAVLTVGTELRERSAAAETARLEALVDLSVEQRKQAEALAVQIARYEGALLRHDRLALPVSISEAVDVFASVMPVELTLSELSLWPRQERVRSKGSNRADATRRWLVFEARGVAPDDAALAQLLSGLERSPLFTQIAVDFTRPVEVRGVQAREFGVSCQVDLEKRYRFESGGEAR